MSRRACDCLVCNDLRQTRPCFAEGAELKILLSTDCPLCNHRIVTKITKTAYATPQS